MTFTFTLTDGQQVSFNGDELSIINDSYFVLKKRPKKYEIVAAVHKSCITTAPDPTSTSNYSKTRK